MGKTSIKDWDTDIVYIRNGFAYLTVSLNAIRIEAKLWRYTHPLAAGWILYMWDTMMPKAPNEFIKPDDIRSKLERQIKENTALNKVHDFLAGANIDESLQKLIRLNHNFFQVYVLYLHKYYLHEHERSSDSGTICGILFKLASSGSGRLDGSTHEQ